MPFDVDGYLRRLGLTHPGPPSVEALHALHRAHVERVPYENLEIQLGRPTTVDPDESADRIVRRRRGRGGYCYHLNGAFSALLGALGYRVRWHVGGVQSRAEPHPVGANANHLALTVSGLPSEEAPDGWWFVDAGLGDALYEPLPLAAGEYVQGPFRYSLRPSEAADGGWRFEHDASGSFQGMDFAPEPAGPADFASRHAWLSSAPESPFVRVAVVQGRDATGVDSLKGCLLSRRDATGTVTREVTSASEWHQAMGDVFGLGLDDVAPVGKAALWGRVRASHEAWLRQEART